jgi:TonB family protein
VDVNASPTVTDVAIPAPDPGRIVAAATGRTRSTSDGDVDGDGGGKAKRGLGSGDAGRAFSENQVERAVVPTRPPVPRYPDALRSVNVTGEVMVQYIVDARGRVEPGSIKILSSTHKLFAEAVREALLEARYRPAEVGGNAVRQLVEQPFIFKLDG